VAHRTSVVRDAGACFVGPAPITVHQKTYTLGCVFLDPDSLSIGFAGHEIGHGLGLTHALLSPI